MDEYSSLSLETLALARKYARGIGADAVREAVAESKLYTDQEIGKILSFEIEIVETLPSDPDTHTIYLVPKTNIEPTNGYIEYIYVNNRLEVIGETSFDLSDYYTKEEVDRLIEEYSYVLPAATADTLGGIKLSSDFDLNENGQVIFDDDAIASKIEDSVQPIDGEDITSLFD